VIAMALALVPTPTAGAASFEFRDGVSTEDESYVREGMSLAQRYVAEHLTTTADPPVSIEVRATDDTVCGYAVACTNRSLIVVFTASPGWIQSAPFARVQTLVHEYVHVHQNDVLAEDADTPPAWFIEGMAEYLGFDAVIRQGLIRRQDVRDYEAWVTDLYPDMPSLAGLEDWDDFQDESAEVYSLAYLAIEELMEAREPADLDRFLIQVHLTHEWRASFQKVFARDVNAFYREIEVKRDELIAPVSMPKPFKLFTPQFIASPLRIELGADAYETGKQLTVLGRSEAAAVCRIRLQSQESGEQLLRTT
jgi:hypothetical protein